jgi:hypothetical protein
MPVVAQATAAVGFMVVITGGVAPVGFQNRYEELTRLDGLSQEEAEAELGLLSDFTGPLGFNTIPILETLGIPLLYLFGGNDEFGPLRANLCLRPATRQFAQMRRGFEVGSRWVSGGCGDELFKAIADQDIEALISGWPSETLPD